jgi:hypothetical protein
MVDETLRRSRKSSANPLEDCLVKQPAELQNEHQRLLIHVQSDAFRKQIAKDRRAEARPLFHNRFERALLDVAAVTTFGVFRHHEKAGPEMDKQLASMRRFTQHLKNLERAASQEGNVEVPYDKDALLHSIEVLIDESRAASRKRKEIAALLEQLSQNCHDPYLQALCQGYASQLRGNNSNKKAGMLAQKFKVEPATFIDPMNSVLESVSSDGNLSGLDTMNPLQY